MLFYKNPDNNCIISGWFSEGITKPERNELYQEAIDEFYVVNNNIYSKRAVYIAEKFEFNQFLDHTKEILGILKRYRIYPREGKNYLIFSTCKICKVLLCETRSKLQQNSLFLH